MSRPNSVRPCVKASTGLPLAVDPSPVVRKCVAAAVLLVSAAWLAGCSSGSSKSVSQQPHSSGAATISSAAAAHAKEACLMLSAAEVQAAFGMTVEAAPGSNGTNPNECVLQSEDGTQGVQLWYWAQAGTVLADAVKANSVVGHESVSGIGDGAEVGPFGITFARGTHAYRINATGFGGFSEQQFEAAAATALKNMPNS